MLIKQLLLFSFPALLSADLAATARIWNPLPTDLVGALTRLPGVFLPGAAGAVCTCGGAALPCQVEAPSGAVWVRVDLAAGAAANCTASVSSAPPPGAATVARVGGAWQLSNGVVAVRVAAAASAGAGAAPPPPPFAGMAYLGGPFLGASSWNLSAGATLASFSSTVTASGPLFVEAALAYAFAGGGSAAWTVRLAAGDVAALVTEAHSVGVDAAVDVALHAGWAPDTAASYGFAYCDANTTLNPSGMLANASQQLAPLAPIARLAGGSLGYFMPRWSQACDSRWFWAARGPAPAGAGAPGAQLALGVLAAHGGRWLWPQYTGQDWSTQRWHLAGPWSAGAGTGFAHLPLWGRRAWYLVSGPPAATSDAAPALALALANVELDRLLNVYDLEWPGVLPAAGFVPRAFYNESTNPTGPVRHEGAALLASLASLATTPPAGAATLGAANAHCDPDWWGSYVGQSSPENPNFFSDWSSLCVGWALAVAARAHPRAASWCALARGVFDADLRHSVTLPGGAGQESPGYTAHAAASWLAKAPALDAICPNASAPAAAHPRLRAAVAFLLRTAQPWAYHFLGPAAADNGDALRGRLVLPLGDTHPTSTNLSALSAAARVPPRPWAQLASEELPGFGALLQAEAGSPRESFAAFKASPNRGHNHGDQLGLHYAAYGARIVIDIMAGYNPRPYQESWHSRLCFGEEQNADGYERLLGFRASAAPGGGDAALGALTSSRLQTLPPLPPQPFLAIFPTRRLPAPLTYRRAAVLVRAPPAAAAAPAVRAYLVLVDAHNGSAQAPPLPAYATLLFHQQDGVVAAPLPGSGGAALDMGNGTVWCFAADAPAGGAAVPLALALDRWDIPSEGNESATRLRAQPQPPGAATAFFVTLLYPDGSAMPAVPGAGGGGGASTPAAAFDAAAATLTLTWSPAQAGGAAAHTDVLAFAGLAVDAGAEPDSGGGARAPPAGPAITLARGGGPPAVLLDGADISYEHSQGDVGLSVTDAGYTFGEMPEWAVRARNGGQFDPLAQPSVYPWPPAAAVRRRQDGGAGA